MQDEKKEKKVDDTENEEKIVVEAVSLEDMTAERDSLSEELTQLKSDYAALKAELEKTKKVNFTLARQIDASKPEDDPDAFLKGVLKGE